MEPVLWLYYSGLPATHLEHEIEIQKAKLHVAPGSDLNDSPVIQR